MFACHFQRCCTYGNKACIENKQTTKKRIQIVLAPSLKLYYDNKLRPNHIPATVWVWALKLIAVMLGSWLLSSTFKMSVNRLQTIIGSLEAVEMKLERSIAFWPARENQGLSQLSKMLMMLWGKSKIVLVIEIMWCVVSVKWSILNGNKCIRGKSMVIIYVDVDGAFRVFGLIKDIFVAFEHCRYEIVSKNKRLCQ